MKNSYLYLILSVALVGDTIQHNRGVCYSVLHHLDPHQRISLSPSRPEGGETEINQYCV